jgi:thiol-disulfide isomerase/thioredoxin
MSHGKIVGIGVAAVVMVFVGFGVWNKTQPGKYDVFAQCLGEKGAVFYGAFWCPHCQEQKALFGNSKDNLPYTECSEPSGQGQLAVCKEKGIERYPTWILKNGERLNSIQSLETLAQKTGCELPL